MQEGAAGRHDPGMGTGASHLPPAALVGNAGTTEPDTYPPCLKVRPGVRQREDDPALIPVAVRT